MTASIHKQAGMSLGELLRPWVEPGGHADLPVQDITTNSRDVSAGTLFLALPGVTGDGRDYIGEAIERGACAVLQEAEGSIATSDRIPVWTVEHLNNLLGQIADRFFGSPSRDLCVIGITGTNGKTTCAHLVAQALNVLDVSCALIGTLGAGFPDALKPTGLTTPGVIRLHRELAVLRKAGATHVCLEVSSHGLDQGRVNGVAFDVAVFTNLSRDHLDYHADMRQYGLAKARLFKLDGLRYALVNWDDPFGRELAQQSTAQTIWTYGRKTGDVHTLSVRQLSGGLALSIETPSGNVVFTAPLIGDLNVANLLAATAVLLATKQRPEQVASALAQVRPVPGRMELFSSPSGQVQVVVDYAHTPDALEQALRSVRAHTQGRLWCVFGCGGDRDHGKRASMGTVAEALSDEQVITDDNPRGEDPKQIVDDIASGMKVEPKIIHERAKAIQWAIDHAGVGDLVMVAGKGHELTQTVGAQVIPFDDRHWVRELLGKVA